MCKVWSPLRRSNPLMTPISAVVAAFAALSYNPEVPGTPAAMAVWGQTFSYRIAEEGRAQAQTAP